MIQEQKFTKHERIVKRTDYLKRHPEDRVVHAAGYRFVFKPSGLPFSRLGIVVTRRDGNAVYRNRVKRVVREVFRKNKKRIKPALDLIVIRRHPAAFPTFENTQKQFEIALAKITAPGCRGKKTGLA
jgi:ribonuclease P protein component